MEAQHCSTVVKTRSGCLNCRKRKIKCDESRPACQKCQKNGRACAGYAHRITQVSEDDILQNRTRPVNASLAVSRPPSCTLSTTTDERRALDFYRQALTPSVATQLDHDLWYVMVLQSSQSDLAIRCAVTAVGALQRHASECAALHTEICSCRSFRLGIQQYSRAVGYLRQRPVLGAGDRIHGVALALFACLEALLGKAHQVLYLANTATSLLEQQRMAENHPFSEFFKRLDIYFHILWQGYRSSHQNSLKSLTLPDEFSNLQHARRILYSLMEEVMSFITLPAWFQGWPVYRSPEDKQLDRARQTRLLASIARWHKASLSLTEVARSTESFAILESYMILAELFVAVAPLRNEHAFNERVSDFAEIVQRASKHILQNDCQIHLFNFELGWMSPLHWVALKCRDSQVRRQAVALMWRLPRPEGMWRRDRLLTLAKRVVERETAGELFQLATASPVYVEDGTTKFRADFTPAAFDNTQPPRKVSEVLICDI